ncbi:MAG: flagellar brake protein [Oscillospiraceae bacterium]|jgi:c-di-GMP-binding flagellar brake protein YcgR|nr:flagellar brake protein [Oscillospiraceae bacterium]
MPELTAGIKLNVFVPSESETGGRVKLTSSLEGFGEGNRFIITAPMKGMARYPINPKQELLLQCHLASAIIEFSAVALQRIEKGSLAYLLLEQIGGFKRTQRRQDFRLDCMKDGKLEYTDPKDGTNKRIKIAVSDISGGGTSVRSPVSFELGTQITIHLPIGDEDDVHTYACEVRRSYRVVDSVEDLKYNVGLQFHFKNAREKEDLIARVFRMERERRKMDI